MVVIAKSAERSKGAHRDSNDYKKIAATTNNCQIFQTSWPLFPLLTGNQIMSIIEIGTSIWCGGHGSRSLEIRTPADCKPPSTSTLIGEGQQETYRC